MVCVALTFVVGGIFHTMCVLTSLSLVSTGEVCVSAVDDFRCFSS